MSLDIARRGDGKWCVMEDCLREVFSHSSKVACKSYIYARNNYQTAEPAELPPPHAALARVEAMQNELIALHVSTWGTYEVPRYGIDARVRHIPTGKLCVVRGYMAWTPPIVLYSLTEVDGPQLDELTPLSDIEAVACLCGDTQSGCPAHPRE